MSALLIPLLLAPCGAPSMNALRYVVPDPGVAMRAPRARALGLSNAAPEDVEVAFHAKGDAVRFGQHLYGDPGTKRVAYALDAYGDGEIDLYVDRDRDRRLTPEERVEPSESSDGRLRWEASIDVVLSAADESTTSIPRRVLFELGETGTVFGIATMGYLEGTVEIDGARVPTRRRDADGNGCFGDAADHLWLDRDGDGFWAPLRELYVTQPILQLADDEAVERYAVRSSRSGEELRLERIDGTGTIRLAIPHPSGDGERSDIAEAAVLLVGRDGGAVRVDGAPGGTEVPVGEYRVVSLSLRLNDPEGGPVWSYLFSTAFEPREEDWSEVSKDATWELDPVGELDFQLSIVSPKGAAAPGSRINAQPYLYTGDRLLIRNVYRGWDAPRYNGHDGARLRLVGADGTSVSEATSGFA